MKKIRSKALFAFSFVAILTLLLIELSAPLTVRFGHFHVQAWAPPWRRLDSNQKSVLETVLAKKNSFLIPNGTLGWSIRPNSVERDMQAHSNSSGMRSTQEYTREVPAGKTRVSVFGDSFVFGNEVQDNDTFTEIINRLYPRFQSLNFGVLGYGPDQSLLNYRERRTQFKSQFVVLGFMAENIFRTVSTFRPFYLTKTDIPFSKPRFKLNGEKLELVPNPLSDLAHYQDLVDHTDRMVPSLGENDYWYQANASFFAEHFFTYRLLRYVYGKYLSHDENLMTMDYKAIYQNRNEAFRVTEAIFSEFIKEAKADGAEPIIYFFPNRWDCSQMRKGRQVSYAPLLESTKAHGYAVLDGKLALESSCNKGDTAFVDTHYSREGNALIARELHEFLEKRTNSLLN